MPISVDWLYGRAPSRVQSRPALACIFAIVPHWIAQQYPGLDWGVTELPATNDGVRSQLLQSYW